MQPLGFEPNRDLVRSRDAALRRTRALIAATTAAAVGLSGAVSVVAAQAFKGHQQRRATPKPATSRVPSAPAPTVRVPGPQSVPAISGQPAPLQPPAQPPAAPTQQQSAPAPAPPPQVSGGS